VPGRSARAPEEAQPGHTSPAKRIGNRAEPSYDLRVVRALTFCLVVSLLAQPAVAKEDKWWAEDKGLHFSLSFALGSAWYTGLWLLGDDPRPVRVVLSLSLAVLPGVFKEIYDAGQPGNQFSGKDMVWDVIGATTGTLVVLGVEMLVRRIFSWRRSAPHRGLAISRTGVLWSL
jgi:uncharacterized protein YfiM (DUF2279 family)